MKKTLTNCRTTNYRKAALTLLLSLLTLCAQAQISLVKWENFFFGSPPILPNTYLPMNNGKELSNAGQSSSFISGGQYIANVWAVGNYFQANFSTINYSSNTIVFLFGAFQFGAKNFKLQYATGTPTTFTDFGAAISFPAAGGSGTYTYNLPANCNNQANVYIRITATSAGGAGGDYLENFEVKGTAMTAPSITSQPGSSTVCEGADATYSLVASNAISYQWQFRTSGAGTFADCPSNATYDNETTAALTVNNVTAAMSGYQFRCIVTGGTTPDATSNTVTMTVNAYGTWNGSANNQWSNTANWDCGQIPTATTNVTINNSGTPPVINVANAVCNNLTINSGATLSFAAGSNQLDVKGNVSGAGTLNASAGKVIFSGTAAQNIPAGTFKDLQMNGSGNKTLTGSVTVTGALTLTSGTLTLGNNNLTLSTTGTNSGANSGSFIVTNGTGMLINQGVGSGGKTGNINFPVGASASSYTPLVLNNNAGAIDNFSVLVKDGVYSNYSGTTGSGALSANAVNKTWFVTEGTPGGSNVNLQLTWNGNNQLSGFDPNNCYLSHYTGSAWSAGPLTFAVGADPFIVSRTGITSFSPFGVGSTGSPLPLDLLDFYGKKTPNGILLEWETANERSILSYSIERSADGNKFETAGNVTAHSAKEQTVYSYTDPTRISPMVFYRLRINHEGGDATYSKVIPLNTAGKDVVNIYPNPVNGNTLYLQVDQAVTSDVRAFITDLSGKRLYTKHLAAAAVNKGICTLSVETLAVGQYILQLYTDDGMLIGKAKLMRQ